jgi:hypothetical protein
VFLAKLFCSLYAASSTIEFEFEFVAHCPAPSPTAAVLLCANLRSHHASFHQKWYSWVLYSQQAQQSKMRTPLCTSAHQEPGKAPT